MEHAGVANPQSGHKDFEIKIQLKNALKSNAHNAVGIRYW